MEPTIENRIESILFPEESIQSDSSIQQDDDIETAGVEETTQDAEEVQEEGEGETPEPTSDEDGIELETLAQVLGLDASKLDVDDDGTLFFKNKIDGIEGKAKLNDLIVSYQKQGHLDKTIKETTELKKSLEAKQADYDSKVSQKLDELDTLGQALIQEFNRDYQSVNWQELRQYEPAEFAAKYTEFQQRQNQLTQVINTIQQNRQGLQEQNKVKMQEQAQEAAKQLREMIPEWSDATTRDKDVSAIETYFYSLGFSQKDYEAIADPRAIVVLRDAARYQEMKKGAPALTKVVRKAPKIAKPGTSQSVKETGVSNLQAKIKKSGGRDGVAEYLMAKGIV